MASTIDVAGRSALEVELLRRTLLIDDRTGTGDAEVAEVVVLVQPTLDQWRAARTHRQRVVLVGGGADPDQVVAAVLDGADAVVSSDADPGHLRRVVERVASGDTIVEARFVRVLVDELRAHRHAAATAAISLTSREREILDAIEAGRSVKQTARELGIAAKTVENVQSRLFRKLGARNRAQAVTVGHELGLFERLDWPAPGPPGSLDDEPTAIP